MSRKNAFFGSVTKPNTVKDSRFGIRKPFGKTEQPSIFSYSSPGKGPNGEHQI